MKASIVSGKLASDLLKSFKPDGKLHFAVMHGRFVLRLEARSCMIKGQPSGGCVISASANPPTYSSRPVSVTKRIKRCDPATIRRHAMDAAEKVRQQRAALIIQLRESVYAEAEQRVFDPDSLPRESSAYEDMTEEECNFWLDWLRKCPKLPG